MRALAYVAVVIPFLVGSTAIAIAAPVNWGLIDKIECTGMSGKSVKVTCVAKAERGNRIYTTVFRFTISGPVARFYIGKHDDCRHIAAAETRTKQDVFTCPGIPEWWN